LELSELPAKGISSIFRHMGYRTTTLLREINKSTMEIVDEFVSSVGIWRLTFGNRIGQNQNTLEINFCAVIHFAICQHWFNAAMNEWESQGFTRKNVPFHINALTATVTP
ncbi:hypothetical protein PMAYCL1PPCAC_27070, partial [Pristionchus mayeri]